MTQSPPTTPRADCFAEFKWDSRYNSCHNYTLLEENGTIHECYYDGRFFRYNKGEKEGTVPLSIIKWVRDDGAPVRADLAQPRAVEKVDGLDADKAYEKWFFTARNPVTDMPWGTHLIYRICDRDDKKFEEAEMIMQTAFKAGMEAARIVAAQQKKAGEDPLAGTPDGVCS